MRTDIITPAEFRTSQWTGGQTTELFIYPEGSDFQSRDFGFRISSATVELEETTFTPLPGFSRILMVLEGELKLVHEGRHEVMLEPLDAVAFDGSWVTRSYGKVRDFNLIMSPAYTGVLEAVEIQSHDVYNQDLNWDDIYGFYVVKGSLECNSRHVSAGELLMISEGTGKAEISGNALFIKIRVVKQPAIEKAHKEDHAQIIAVWESSVRATHHFLQESDILFYKSLIADQFLDMVDLYAIRDTDRNITGFLGVSDDNIEMLFIHPGSQGKGLGKTLLLFGIHNLGMRKVDVNEQNEAALKFYNQFGFKQVNRSALDGMGKPFPILHLEISSLEGGQGG